MSSVQPIAAASLHTPSQVINNQELIDKTTEAVQRLSTLERPLPTDKEIKLALIARGVLPTPEKAKETFWRLGPNWWRQIIDGMWQEFGEEVFDRGLHDGTKEPGYLQSVKEGCIYFADRLGEEFSLDLYKQVHHEACKHFRGKENNTLCDASSIDRFRTDAEKSNREWDYIRNFSKPFAKLQSTPENHIIKLNEEIAATAKRIGCEPFTHFSIAAPNLKIIYHGAKEPFERIAEKLIAEFNKNISDLRRKVHHNCETTDLGFLKSVYQSEAVPLIARLFAELDWLHPWVDGQGRTDLITLNALLCREGIHPCILEEPFYATFNTRADWVDYLYLGLEEYKKLCVSLEVKLNTRP